MKKMVKKFKLVLVVGMIIVPSFLMAQEEGTSDPSLTPSETSDPPPLPCDGSVGDVTNCPLDGGVSLLVAAGLAFGIKRVYNNKKEEKAQF